MDLKRPELQKFSDALTEFERVVEKAKKELISSIKLKQQQHNQVDTLVGDLISLKRKLHDEKIANSLLNQKISELTEEKNRVELSLELTQESQEDAEKQLRQAIKRRKHLEWQLQLATEESREKRASHQVILPTSTSNSREPSKSPLSSSSTNCSRKTEDVRFEKPGPACSKRKGIITTTSSPSSSHDTKRRKQTRESPTLTSGSIKSDFLDEGSILTVPEFYRVNYGFSNNYTLDLCPHSRDFWYDSANASSTKYLIRFFDDDREKPRRGLTVKEQIGLAEPTVFQLSFTEIVQRLEENMKKAGGIRIWIDVRDWNIFSHGVSQFFHDFGSFVTNFSFGHNLYSTEEVGGDQLLEFIFKNLPNLEYLALTDSMLKRLDLDFSLPHSAHDHSLQKLKVLRLFSVRFSFGSPFVMAILLRAPTLSRIYGFPLHLLEEVERQFLNEPNTENFLKICTNSLKSVVIYRTLFTPKKKAPNRFSYFNSLTTLCRLQPNLEELDTRIFFILSREGRQRCLEKLSEILQLNAHSLKLLRLQPLSDSDFDSLKFPRLENIETLQLEMKLVPISKQRLFPRGIDLSDVFPNLKSVEIMLDEKSGDKTVHTVQNSLNGQRASDLFHAHFPSDTFRSLRTVKTVQRLHLVNFTPMDLMAKFQKRFPHITILCLNQIMQVLIKILPQCFSQWPKLKQLVLELTLFSDRQRNLDSALTGIPHVTCKVLENRKAEDIQERIDEYRNRPSICNLKDLTLLKIVVLHKGKLESEIQSRLMTPVSAIYGFGKELMPNLNVIIGFDDRVSSQHRLDIVRQLEPMKSYLTIDD